MALLLLIVFYREKFSHAISIPIMAAGDFFLEKNQDISEWVGNNTSYLKQKKSLEEENQRLKEKVSELEIKSLICQTTKEENNKLREIFYRSEEKGQELILAGILKRAPELPFGTLIIDAGSNNGIRNGAQVTVSGEALVGHIVEVFESSSKVKLISSTGEITKVIVGQESLALEAKGIGGESMEIDIPREININIGDIVSLPGINGLILGTVAKVEENSSDPFKKIIFRLPINLKQLKFLMVEK